MKIVLPLLAVVLMVLPANLRAEEPISVIKTSVEKVVSILTDPQYDPPEQIDEQREKIWEVIRPMFDFELIAKRAAGRYHWQNSFTSEQRREFTDLFAEFLANGSPYKAK